MNIRRYRGIACCLIISLIWGFAFVAQVTGMEHVGPFTFLGLRSLLAAAVLSPLAIASRRNKEHPSHPPADNRTPLWKAGLLCGVFLFISSAFQQCGLMYTSVGKGGFITALYVVLVPMTRLFFGHRPSALLWGCVGLTAAGLWLLCIQPGEHGFNYGDFLILLCAVTLTCHILIVDRYAPCFAPVQLSCLQFLVCGLICVPLMLTEDLSWAAISGAAVPLLYAGVLSSGLAYTLQIIAQRDTDPTVCSMLLCLESVFSVLAGWLLLDQALSPRELLGCAVMFAAILLAQLPAAQKTTPKAQKVR